MLLIRECVHACCMCQCLVFVCMQYIYIYIYIYIHLYAHILDIDDGPHPHSCMYMHAQIDNKEGLISAFQALSSYSCEKILVPCIYVQVTHIFFTSLYMYVHECKHDTCSCVYTCMYTNAKTINAHGIVHIFLHTKHWHNLQVIIVF